MVRPDIGILISAFTFIGFGLHLLFVTNKAKPSRKTLAKGIFLIVFGIICGVYSFRPE